MTSEKATPLRFTLIEGGTRTGRNLLVSSDGNTYNCSRSNKKGTIWKCSGWSFCKKNGQVLRKRCSATVSEINKSFFWNCQTHNHPTRSNILGSILHRYQMKKLARLYTSSEVKSMFDEKTGNVYYNGQMGYHTPTFKSKASFLKSFQHSSHTLGLKEPTDIQFDIDIDYLDSFTSSNFFRCDLRGVKTRHLIFATDEQLEIMSGAKLWVISRSLKFCNSVFSQLLVVHVYGHKPGEKKLPSAFPCLFVMMSRNRKSDYKRVFHAISGIMPSYPKVKEVIICYDSALLEAFQPFFPLVTIRIDLVRWWEALRAKIRDLHLKEIELRERQRIHDACRKLFALPFILQENIRDAFDLVVKEAGDARAMEIILDCVRAFWIDNNIWSSVRLSVFGKYIIDEIEYDSWIDSLSKKLMRRRSKFYFLIPRLYQEAMLKPADFKVLSAKSLQRQFEEKISVQQTKLCQLWAQYVAKEIDLDVLLTKCSVLYCRRYKVCHNLWNIGKLENENSSMVES